MITPEMHFKFQTIHPQPDQYAFAEADALVAFAVKNNMRMHGHTLVWHEALPQWVWDLYNSRNYPALRQALMDHISTLVTRYRSNVHEWDTLNEIFSDASDEPYGLRSDAEEENSLSVWYKAFGAQIYIDALRKVKEIDPGAENRINGAWVMANLLMASASNQTITTLTRIQPWLPIYRRQCRE